MTTTDAHTASPGRGPISAVQLSPSFPARSASRKRTLRWGLAVLGLVLLMVAVAVLRGEPDDGLSNLPTATAQRGPLTISVSESGTIRPREQLILRNELDDPATIISIVDEGKSVKKGDLLVELDVTASRKELVERRIRVQSAEAAVRQRRTSSRRNCFIGSPKGTSSNTSRASSPS